MRMWCLTNDKDIPVEETVEITLEDAFKEVKNFPSEEEYDGPEGGPFLGFTNEEDEAIQFPYREEELWVIDIPVLSKGKFAFTVNAYLMTSEVNAVIALFFNGLSNMDALLKAPIEKPSLEEKIEEILSMEPQPTPEVMRSFHLLVDDKDWVECDVYIENRKLAEPILSELTKRTSLRLVSVKELLDKKKK